MNIISKSIRRILAGIFKDVILVHERVFFWRFTSYKFGFLYLSLSILGSSSSYFLKYCFHTNNKTMNVTTPEARVYNVSTLRLQKSGNTNMDETKIYKK